MINGRDLDALTPEEAFSQIENRLPRHPLLHLFVKHTQGSTFHARRENWGARIIADTNPPLDACLCLRSIPAGLELAVFNRAANSVFSNWYQLSPLLQATALSLREPLQPDELRFSSFAWRLSSPATAWCCQVLLPDLNTSLQGNHGENSDPPPTQSIPLPEGFIIHHHKN